MKCDPERHHRHSLRLQDYDYTQAGFYFVTICTYKRECLFGDAGVRRLAESSWLDLPRHFPNVVLDEYVLMPNHLHGILILLDCPDRKGEAFPRPCREITTHQSHTIFQTGQAPQGNASRLRPHSLGAVIGNFKSISARRINTARLPSGGPVWQRNYYEHIIRGEGDLDRVREYIISNPLHWDSDENNPLHYVGSSAKGTYRSK